MCRPGISERFECSSGRVAIVKIRTVVKNEVHALIDKYGFTCPYSDIFGKAGLEWLRSLQLPTLDRLILDNKLTHLESLNQQTERRSIPATCG
jgi:hypothetical protein